MSQKTFILIKGQNFKKTQHSLKKRQELENVENNIQKFQNVLVDFQSDFLKALTNIENLEPLHFLRIQDF